MKKIKKFPWKGITLLILSILTGSWVADGLKGESLFIEWFPVLEEWKLLITGIIFVLFIFSVLGLYHYRKEFLGFRTLEQVQTKPHTCLILLFSYPNIVPQSFSFPLKIKDRHGNEVELQGESLEDDINALNKINYWNWQQILRGLRPHKTLLKYVYLIGSSGEKSSYKYIDDVEKLIKQYVKDITVLKAKKAVDFEDLEKLIEIISKAIRELKEKYGLEDRDIIVDVTGGQKTTSIAGAVVTFNSNITFQYVQTGKKHDVLAYDVDIESPVSI